MERLNKIKKLPSIPSQLIRLAIKDLEKVEKMKTRKVHMGNWHVAEDGICYVCLAGAVMDQTLKSDPKKNIDPFETDFPYQLQALNNFRRGLCGEGFRHLKLDKIEGVKFSRKITFYEYSPTKFKKEMLKLASDLEEKGY